MQKFRIYEIGFYINFRKNYKNFTLKITWTHNTQKLFNTHEASIRVAILRPATSFKYCSIVCK